MNSREVFRTRRRKIMELVKEDSIIVSDPTHIYYLTGLEAAIEPRDGILTPRNPMFLGISRNGSMFLVAGRSSLVNPFWRGEIVFDSKNLFEGNLYTYEDYDPNERVVAPLDFVSEELSEVIAEMKSRRGFELGRVGIEEWHIQREVTERLLAEFPTIEFSGISGKLRRMRMVKDESEVRCIAEGVGRLRSTLDRAGSLAEVGETELGLFRKLAGSFRDQYGEGVPLLGQVVSGRRTLEVVGMATEKRLEEGESMILDLQTRVDGYWARAVRTARVGRRLGGEGEIEREIASALSKGEGALHPGRKAAEVFTAISGEIARKGGGVSSGLVHEAGHGVGLEVREAPYFIPSSHEEIVAGMVCTLMAGRYDSSLAGARFSDCYWVGEDGAMKL